MLQSFGFGVGSIANGDALATVALIAVKNHHGAFLGVANVHAPQVKTIDRKPQVISNADGELAEQRLLAGNAVAGQSELHTLTLLTIDQRTNLMELAALAARVK